MKIRSVIAFVSCFVVFSSVDAFTADMPSKPHAKAVIQIWLWGGPSHLDIFDPKPDAGYDYCGPLGKPIQTNVEGIKIGELLPLLAKQADKYSLIRSVTHGSNAHETAAYMMQTGHEPGVGLTYPTLGALVSYFRGYSNGYKGLIPPYIVLTEGQGRFAEEGFLGPKYKPFVTGGDPSKTPFEVEGVVAKGISDQRQKDRRELLKSLDSLGKAIPDNPDFALLEKCRTGADQLILGNERKVFDLSEESAATRDKYGRNKFGQSCLAARRLVERGVRHITINYSGWDTHKQQFTIFNRKLPELDQGLAALLQDLSDKGLLDSTIVLCYGEFGRAPKIGWEAPWNGGRGHYGKCFSALVAGGGFKGGRVVGASDATGENVLERPVYPQDLIGSVLELLGIDPDAKMPNDKGLDIKIMPSKENGPGKGRLKEIM
ncbi:MAG: DUF1501 domain-containing protein [Armatimonadetes bacterium]|nr:DUF1501 domain-containing protein [Armatimonadota bacterium]